MFCVPDLLRAQFIVKRHFEACSSQTASVSSGRTGNSPTQDTSCLKVTLTAVTGLRDGRLGNSCWIPWWAGVGGKSKKVKCTLVQALRLCTGLTTHMGSRGILCSFLTTALEGGEGLASRPDRSLPPGKSRYPLYRRLGGPQGNSIPGPSSP